MRAHLNGGGKLGVKPFQVTLSKKWDPVFKITRAKKAGGMTQAAECLPSKWKALSSKSSSAKQTKNNNNNKKKPWETIFQSGHGTLPYCKQWVPICLNGHQHLILSFFSFCHSMSAGLTLASWSYNFCFLTCCLMNSEFQGRISQGFRMF
jgi:hypothetical protein